MIETRNGVVVFLDALGISDYNNDKCKIFVKNRDEIKDELKFVVEKWKIQLEEELGKILLKPNIATFQDSIILWWPEQKANSLDFFLGAGHIVTAIINLAIQRKIFLRGAISVGEYIYDESSANVTIIGQAVADAYKYHAITDWIGVIQTPRFRREYLCYLNSVADNDNVPLNAVIKKYSTFFVPCNIPLHKDKNEIGTLSMEKFFAVSWPQLTYQIENKGCEQILSILLYESHRPENAKYKSKYDNTLIFAEWYKDNEYYPPPA